MCIVNKNWNIKFVIWFFIVTPVLIWSLVTSSLSTLLSCSLLEWSKSARQKWPFHYRTLWGALIKCNYFSQVPLSFPPSLPLGFPGLSGLWKEGVDQDVNEVLTTFPKANRQKDVTYGFCSVWVLFSSWIWFCQDSKISQIAFDNSALLGQRATFHFDGCVWCLWLLISWKCKSYVTTLAN